MKSELESILDQHDITLYKLAKKANVTLSLLYNLKAQRHNIRRVKLETFISIKETLEGLTDKQYTFKHTLRLLDFKPKDLD